MLLILVVCVGVKAPAQTANVRTDSCSVIQEAGKGIYSMLNSYIAYMANPKNSLETRRYYKAEAQQLFINDCNPFTEIVEFEDGTKEVIPREGAIIDMVSLRNMRPQKIIIKMYFNGLIHMNYKYVEIGTADIIDMRVSKLEPYDVDPEGKRLYVCSVYFDHLLTGVTPEGRICQEIRHKWVVCHVKVEEVQDPTSGETYNEFMVKFGDIYVESIEKLW